MVERMLLLTDLDRTVLYSHRHAADGEKIWVEALNGHPQSFVTETTYRFFRTQDWLDVVPVTTRTKPQFDRLRGALAAFGWRDTLICNGSILLRDGVEDTAWTEGSVRISEASRPDYERAREFAAGLAGKDAVVSADPFLFYIKTDRAETVFNALSAHTDPAKLTVLRDSRKVYCFPQALNKGRAAERYRRRAGHEAYLAAGDSEFDIPMLQNAAVGFCPESLAHYEAKGEVRVCGGLFSDGLCDGLEKIRNEGL